MFIFAEEFLKKLQMKKRKQILLMLSLMLVASYANAQGFPPPPPGLPIDGGLAILALSAVAYGVKKLKK